MLPDALARLAADTAAILILTSSARLSPLRASSALSYMSSHDHDWYGFACRMRGVIGCILPFLLVLNRVAMFYQPIFFSYVRLPTLV